MVDYTLFTQVFNETTFFGSKALIFIFLTALTCVMITRNLEQWKVLAFPVSIGWLVSGIKPSIDGILIITVFMILFIIESLSFTTIGKSISLGTGWTLDKMGEQTRDKFGYTKKWQSKDLKRSRIALEQEREFNKQYAESDHRRELALERLKQNIQNEFIDTHLENDTTYKLRQEAKINQIKNKFYNLNPLDKINKYKTLKKKKSKLNIK